MSRDRQTRLAHNKILAHFRLRHTHRHFWHLRQCYHSAYTNTTVDALTQQSLPDGTGHLRHVSTGNGLPHLWHGVYYRILGGLRSLRRLDDVFEIYVRSLTYQSGLFRIRFDIEN